MDYYNLGNKNMNNFIKNLLSIFKDDSFPCSQFDFDHFERISSIYEEVIANINNEFRRIIENKENWIVVDGIGALYIDQIDISLYEPDKEIFLVDNSTNKKINIYNSKELGLYKGFKLHLDMLERYTKFMKEAKKDYLLKNNYFIYCRGFYQTTTLVRCGSEKFHEERITKDDIKFVDEEASKTFFIRLNNLNDAFKDYKSSSISLDKNQNKFNDE